MNNITGKQWLQILGSAISGLITGAALLQTLLGQDLALKAVAILGVANIILGSVVTSISGQAQLIKDVAAMPGIEKITVNQNANQTVAQVAVSSAPDARKVEALPSVEATVSNIAQGTKP